MLHSVICATAGLPSLLLLLEANTEDYYLATVLNNWSSENKSKHTLIFHISVRCQHEHQLLYLPASAQAIRAAVEASIQPSASRQQRSSH